jgi:hypothetical protein
MIKEEPVNVLEIDLQTQISYLRDLEIQLGNLPATRQDWQSDWLHQRQKSLLSQESMQPSEAATKKLFDHIVSQMYAQGHSFEKIASHINEQMYYDHLPPYCNEAEVEESFYAKKQ